MTGSDTSRSPLRPTIHQQFEAQVRQAPDAVATVCGSARWNYDELNRRANQAARSLRESGAGPESCVGLLLERSPEMAAGMLAILKSGAAFVPLDPGYPHQRLELMTRDARIQTVLTHERHLGLVADLPVTALVPTQSAGLPDAGDPTWETIPDHIAYVVYTSGSTGHPKGVGVSHANFMPLMAWAQEIFSLGSHTRALQTLSFGFDFGVFEVLSTLLFGGTLYFPERNELRDLERYGQLVEEHAVNTFHSTPSIFKQVAEFEARLDTIDILHLGGEAIHRSTVEAAFDAAPSCTLFNGYGPTETTVNSHIFALRSSDRATHDELPIGQATAHATTHVLDASGQPMADGEEGELVIGGGGVTRGYLGRPAPSAERFVPDPSSDSPGARRYRSGDNVRQLDDGNLHFLGRFDFQVKIRGFRIELGEIESALEQHDAIRDAAVLVRKDDEGRKELVAYMTGQPGGRPTPRDLASFLQSKLPPHMVPSTWRLLDALPLNASGKVDRKALAEIPEAAFSDAPASGGAMNITAAQSLFWFTHKIYDARQLYYDRTPVAFTIEGELDPVRFRNAFQSVVDRSDILRSYFEEIGGLPHRGVHDSFPVEIEVADLSRLEAPDAALESWQQQWRKAPMSLESRLLRCALVKLNQQRWVWFLNLYHILLDAYAIPLILQFVSDHYQRSLEGTEDKVPELVPFQEYVELAEELRQSQRYEKAREYWQAKLSQPLVPNPFYGGPGETATTNTTRISLELGAERSQLLRDLTRDLGFFSPAVIFATLIFAFQHRLNGERRLRLGTPFASRPPRFRECIGLFMTVCPTEVEVADDETLISLARKAQMEIARTTRHEFYPVRNSVAHPAYDVHLNFQNITFGDFCGLPVQFRLLMTGRSNDRLNLQVRDFEDSGQYTLDFDFNLGAFAEEDQRQRSTEHFLNLIDALLADPEQPLGQVRLLSEEEERRLLELGAAERERRIYIVDRWLNLVPHGIAGEVYVDAKAASPHDTALPEGFSDSLGRRLVATGQRARWRPDGTLESLETPTPASEEALPTEEEAPRSPLESKLANIYERVLGVEKVGIHDDFFELGGNSILATHVVLKAREEMSLKLPLRHVFEAGTVARLAELARETSKLS